MVPTMPDGGSVRPRPPDEERRDGRRANGHRADLRPVPSTRRGRELEPHETEQLEGLRALGADALAVEVVNLRRAIASNRRIGAAVGVVMRERDIDYDEAFALLRRASQDNNVPLVEVAQTVLHLRKMWD